MRRSFISPLRSSSCLGRDIRYTSSRCLLFLREILVSEIKCNRVGSEIKSGSSGRTCGRIGGNGAAARPISPVLNCGSNGCFAFSPRRLIYVRETPPSFHTLLLGRSSVLFSLRPRERLSKSRMCYLAAGGASSSIHQACARFRFATWRLVDACRLRLICGGRRLFFLFFFFEDARLRKITRHSGDVRERERETRRES